MPYEIERHAKDDYSVVNVETGKVHAKHTTRAKAEAQVRLLRGVEHGMVPMGHREPVESRAVDKGHFQGGGFVEGGPIHPDMRKHAKYGGARAGDVPSKAPHAKHEHLLEKNAPAPVDEGRFKGKR